MTKEYLLAINENNPEAIGLIRKLGITLLEVQGMALGGNNNAMLLAAPIRPPVPPLDLPTPEPIPAAPETPPQTEPSAA